MAKAAPRKKLPKELAVINADNCTGCESCLEVCPVDCIELNNIGNGVKSIWNDALDVKFVFTFRKRRRIHTNCLSALGMRLKWFQQNWLPRR